MFYRDIKQITRINQLEGSTITIAKAMRVIGNKIEQPLPKLIKAILNKELAVTNIKRKPDNRNIRSLAIANGAFKEWIKRTIKPNNYLSIPQLAKLLTINQESAYQLVNMEIINFYVDNNSSQKLIKTTDLETFKARYVFLAGLSKTIKIGGRTLIEYLASREIFPIDYQWQLKLRHKIYYRAQLMNVALVSGVCSDIK